MAILNARRDRRFPAQVPVTILSLRGDVSGVTENASYRGVLIRTEQSPPARQLVRLRIAVPGHGDIVTNGMVVHLASVGAGVTEVGVSFYGLDGQPRAAWEKFIQSLQASERPAAGDKAAPASSPAGPREAGRELVVAVASVDALERLVSRDIARGRLRIQADPSLVVGAPVCIRLVHPETHASLVLDGKVRLRLDGGSLSIELAPIDDSTRTRLADFAKGEEEGFVVDLASLRPPAQSIESRVSG